MVASANFVNENMSGELYDSHREVSSTMVTHSAEHRETVDMDDETEEHIDAFHNTVEYEKEISGCIEDAFVSADSEVEIEEPDSYQVRSLQHGRAARLLHMQDIGTASLQGLHQSQFCASPLVTVGDLDKMLVQGKASLAKSGIAEAIIIQGRNHVGRASLAKSGIAEALIIQGRNHVGRASLAKSGIAEALILQGRNHVGIASLAKSGIAEALILQGRNHVGRATLAKSGKAEALILQGRNHIGRASLAKSSIAEALILQGRNHVARMSSGAQEEIKPFVIQEAVACQTAPICIRMRTHIPARSFPIPWAVKHNYMNSSTQNSPERTESCSTVQNHNILTKLYICIFSIFYNRYDRLRQFLHR